MCRGSMWDDLVAHAAPTFTGGGGAEERNEAQLVST